MFFTTSPEVETASMSESQRDGGGGKPRPQLRIWSKERESSIGSLLIEGQQWEAIVMVEPVSKGLFRGTICFRDEEVQYETVPVIIEDSADGVWRRAEELTPSILRQLFAAARG